MSVDEHKIPYYMKQMMKLVEMGGSQWGNSCWSQNCLLPYQRVKIDEVMFKLVHPLREVIKLLLGHNGLKFVQT